jgi:ACS family hexuronate transporter-like MFS transporter
VPQLKSRLRWYVAGLLCFASALNYLDRQTLSVLAQTIQTDLGITTIGYSHITTAFLASYTVMYAVSGRLVDRLGTRRSFLLFVSGWSVANLLHTFARTVLQFSCFRFLLGATESANFPAGVKAIAEWFPVRERALAVGIFNSGTAVGSALAAPIVAYIALVWGWRFAFVAGGGLGLVWVTVWAWTYRTPRSHPRISAAELALIEGPGGETAALPVPPLSVLLKQRVVWGCVLARLLTDPVSYFFIFWIPKFLQQDRGFSLAGIGWFSWIPFASAALGNVAGGAIPSYLARHGWTVNRSRKTVMFVSSVLIAASCLAIIPLTQPVWAITLISIATFANGSWANITLPAEVLPTHVIGTVSGLGGAMGGVMGILSQLAIGWVVQNYSFTPVFIYSSLIHLTAFAVVCWLIREIGKIVPIPS